MNVFYEEDGAFKVGAVLADNNTSLQVEAAHGKRSKIKANAVVLRFEQPGLTPFLDSAQKVADELDANFLWEVAPQDEFEFGVLAKDYFGHEPSPPESAGLLIRLHGSPMHFYKKGKGRYRAAPADALKAALASVERKRQQAAAQAEYVAQLTRFELPEGIRTKLDELLYEPDKGSIEFKALEAACAATGLGAPHLLERCGAIPSSHDYHLRRFLREHFPQGTGFDAVEPADDFAGLPLAEVQAFSIDDATTTEIDDALSVTALAGGGWKIGIHIAAPALGIGVGGPLDQVAARRLSTVYMPGRKITMLPDAVIDRFTLAQGSVRPVLSLYALIDADLAPAGFDTRIERVTIAANLRHDTLEDRFNETTLAAGTMDFPWGTELELLWRYAGVLEAARGKADNGPDRQDYNFYVDDDRVRIVERKRGSPVDKLVAEMMILANAEWGRQLSQADVPGIYRVQGGGKVRMSTVPAPHEGLGVAQYAWSSSPLRRFVDLVNQRQIIALTRGEAPPYRKGGDELVIAMRDFELAYDAYAEFQRGMERYWCLRWILQEAAQRTRASVVRESLVRIDRIPLYLRTPSLPDLAAGTPVEVELSAIDLLTLECDCRFVGKVAETP
ncbi:MAG: RNB domain-containing ribonuclease [Burkholderiales bacterium]|nr:RNB domain-containing ribonuclease [Burkholderiales bacterium]